MDVLRFQCEAAVSAQKHPVPLSQIGLRELNYLLNGDLFLCIMQ